MSHVSTCSRIDQVGRVQAAQVAEALRSCGYKAGVQLKETTPICDSHHSSTITPSTLTAATIAAAAIASEPPSLP